MNPRFSWKERELVPESSKYSLALLRCRKIHNTHVFRVPGTYIDKDDNHPSSITNRQFDRSLFKFCISYEELYFDFVLRLYKYTFKFLDLLV